MKTPREILFQRHEAADPKLDALRRKIVAPHCAPAARPPIWLARWPAHLSPPLWFWRELFWPCRRIWTGLAAVWLVLVIVNFSMRDEATSRLAQSPPTTQMLMGMRNQETLLNELLADRDQPVEALPSRTFTPKPRSEIAGLTEI